MPNMIEPNIHPVIVHFTVALLLTSTLAFLAIQLAPKEAMWRVSLKSAADWMFAFGVIAAIAAVAAGLQAYYSVAHDAPSHAAMTVHRNIAIPTAGAFILLGVWRWTRRKKFPSALFAIVLLIAASGLATTAWWGGRLVYHHGLGVKSMPVVTGDGHDHDHGAVSSSAASPEEDHDNSNGHHDAADGNGHNHAEGGHGDGAAMTDGPESVVDAHSPGSL